MHSSGSAAVTATLSCATHVICHLQYLTDFKGKNDGDVDSVMKVALGYQYAEQGSRCL